MIEFIVALLFLAVAVLAVVMQKTYDYLPTRELKRQAEQHDPLAMTLWQAVAYGTALRLLLWLVAALGAAIGLVLLSHLAPTVLAMIAVGCLLLLTFGWLPNTRLTSLGGRLTVWATPAAVWLLTQLNPVLSWGHRQLRRYATDYHTGLFQRDDLIELLERQKRQPDNRVSDDELDMAVAALQFGTKRVRDIVVPRKKVSLISASDDLGPVRLDELHKSQHTRFPVYDGKKDNIVGVLYLYDVMEYRGKGQPKVSQLMQSHVYFVHESDSLVDALHTFYQVKRPLFVVVNSFDEFVGIITIEDIVAQLMGRPMIEELRSADSRAEVVARHPKQPIEAETAEAAPADAPAEAAADPTPSDTPVEPVAEPAPTEPTSQTPPAGQPAA